ncbi:MAG TPA: STAS/SEC14 domain-containing protein [Dongiaceae bacterium]|jgi:hypothetical protein|nr:STAS/SEC14 domain-containing protein [Dongiaceae bacterium]
MIDLVRGLPGNVVGFSAHGLVTEDDYRKVLIPAVENALKLHDRIRVYYEIGPNFTGFDLGAMFADVRIGASRLFHWERIALVTDVPWIRDSARLFSFLIPAQIRTFDTADALKAKTWIVAG